GRAAAWPHRLLVRVQLRTAGLLPDRLADRDPDERARGPGQAQDRPRAGAQRVLALAVPGAGQRHGEGRPGMSPDTSWRDWGHAAAAFPPLMDGFKVTLLATVLGTLIALVLGLVVAMVRRSTPALIIWSFTLLLEVTRMTPLVGQLVCANLVLSPYVDSALAIGVWVLRIRYTSYMAEVCRAAIDSVPKGQWEAATALSLPR